MYTKIASWTKLSQVTMKIPLASSIDPRLLQCTQSHLNTHGHTRPATSQHLKICEPAASQSKAPDNTLSYFTLPEATLS